MAPEPLNSKGIMRVGAAGALLGIIAVGLFIGIWVGLGELGLSPFPRMVAAVCLPPALMAGGLAGYIFFLQQSQKKDTNN